MEVATGVSMNTISGSLRSRTSEPNLGLLRALTYPRQEIMSIQLEATRSGSSCFSRLSSGSFWMRKDGGSFTAALVLPFPALAPASPASSVGSAPAPSAAAASPPSSPSAGSWGGGASWRSSRIMYGAASSRGEEPPLSAAGRASRQPSPGSSKDSNENSSSWDAGRAAGAVTSSQSRFVAARGPSGRLLAEPLCFPSSSSSSSGMKTPTSTMESSPSPPPSPPSSSPSSEPQ
mmetsp:Transcript_24112/g.67048  ORF Transcript_24112/g.67048 Transcript_24112/m.67048 type:complete len:233 (-) Transcript_24112:118-816(-)